MDDVQSFYENSKNFNPKNLNSKDNPKNYFLHLKNLLLKNEENDDNLKNIYKDCQQYLFAEPNQSNSYYDYNRLKCIEILSDQIEFENFDDFLVKVTSICRNFEKLDSQPDIVLHSKSSHGKCLNPGIIVGDYSFQPTLDEVLTVLNILLAIFQVDKNKNYNCKANFKSTNITPLLQKTSKNSQKLISNRAKLLLTCFNQDTCINQKDNFQISNLFDEDDLLIYYLSNININNTKKFQTEFKKFLIFLNFNTTLLLDYIIYDDKNASFLKILLRVAKSFSNQDFHSDQPAVFNFLNNFFSEKLASVENKNLLPYSVATLITIWVRNRDKQITINV